MTPTPEGVGPLVPDAPCDRCGRIERVLREASRWIPGRGRRVEYVCLACLGRPAI